MSTSPPIDSDPEFIRPLSDAQNEFLQVLLSTFSIRQAGRGLVLNVEFDFETPAIWLRKGKSYVRRRLNPESMHRYQQELERILLGGELGDWRHNDPAFPFRFGNGGTLPVIRCKERDYYCLFYREVAPIGWNIANGGAESTAELLDPLATIERELREELIIIEPAAGHRYVFDWSEGRRADHPDFAIARRVWHEIFRKRDFGQLRDLALPLKWLRGHDSVVIRFNSSPSQPTTVVEVGNCLLNVNAEDFGIEVDRVAKIAVGPDAIFCDGEVVRGSLLNRVIGLFEVNRFHAAMAAGRTEFQPDRIFHNGKERSMHELQTVVGEYIDDVTNRGVWARDVLPEWESATCKFGLCPVTRNVIRRFLLMEQDETSSVEERRSEKVEPPVSQAPDVFLSFASEDLPLAEQVYSFLQKTGREVFFSNETLHQANFSDAVDDALRVAKSLVVVGTQTERFYKPWVRYEWQSFHNDILAGRKPWETPLVTLAELPDKSLLPRPLVFREVVKCDPSSPASSFQKLDSVLGQTRK